MKINKVVLILLSSLIASACTWVDLNPEAKDIRMLSMDEVAKQNCHKMGSTMVSVKADVATFARDKEKVATELETLARNSALELGGNVVVPASEIDMGKQSFVVYTCR